MILMTLMTFGDFDDSGDSGDFDDFDDSDDFDGSDDPDGSDGLMYMFILRLTKSLGPSPVESTCPSYIVVTFTFTHTAPLSEVHFSSENQPRQFFPHTLLHLHLSHILP